MVFGEFLPNRLTLRLLNQPRNFVSPAFAGFVLFHLKTYIIPYISPVHSLRQLKFGVVQHNLQAHPTPASCT